MKTIREKKAILLALFALICVAGSKKLEAQCCNPSYQSCACFDSNGNQIPCNSGDSTDPDPMGGIGD